MAPYQADNYILAAGKCGLQAPKSAAYLEKNKSFSSVYTIVVDDGEVSNFTFYAQFKGNTLVNLVDTKGVYLYKNGAAVTTYLYPRYIDRATLQYHTEEVVKSILKAPSTALFPGGFLNPYEGWQFGLSKDIIYVSSSVDSENSFGAMLRAQFQLGYRYNVTTKVYSLTYLRFDGRTYFDKRTKAEK